MVRKKPSPVRDRFQQRLSSQSNESPVASQSTPRNSSAGVSRQRVVDYSGSSASSLASTIERNAASRYQQSSASSSPFATPQPTAAQRRHLAIVRRPSSNLYHLPRPQGVKKRAKPGAKVLTEIRKLQRTTNLLIPRAPFARLVREVIGEMSRDEKHIAREALLALQEASEAFLVTIFECMNRAALHARRVTIMPADLNLVRWILIAFNAFSFG
ncbi:histone 3 [Aphelenchoides avenae]|nr:histone 3 [Aphelenchus avenae]